jgi:tetratricopeptide (TPR) repeat protein
MLGDILMEVIEEEGVDAAIEKYRELRQEYYGGFSYDFSEGVLTSMAETLGEQEKSGEAMLEYYPESVYAHFVLAGTYEQSGDEEAAIETLEKALSLAPDSQKAFLQQQIDRLKSP